MSTIYLLRYADETIGAFYTTTGCYRATLEGLMNDGNLADFLSEFHKSNVLSEEDYQILNNFNYERDRLHYLQDNLTLYSYFVDNKGFDEEYSLYWYEKVELYN